MPSDPSDLRFVGDYADFESFSLFFDDSL